MSGLSNIELRIDALAPQTAAALALILDVRGQAARENVPLLLASLRDRGQDLAHLRIVEGAGQVRFAALPLMLPGRCAMLLLPPSLSTGIADAAEAIRRACVSAGEAGATMIHCLLETGDSPLREAALAGGFREIATLQFCSRSVRPAARFSVGDLRWIGYAPELRSRFEALLLASYAGSLDCPGLAGTRSVGDIVDTHMASGMSFEPGLWQIAVDKAGHDVGVLLLARTAHQHFELTYLGLPPAARGQGLGRAIMLHAMHQIAQDGGGDLALAVDARNTPAKKLYNSLGFAWMYDKLALARW